MSAEFGIHSVERSGINEARIVGRCFRGPLRLGVRLRTACLIESAPSGAIPRRVSAAVVDLEVMQIQAYGRSMQELDEGLTASIVVRGTGIELLVPAMSVSESE